MEYSPNELNEEVEHLRRQVKLLEKAASVAHTADLIWLHDVTGKIIRVNDEVDDLFEVQADDGTRMNLGRLVAPDMRDTFRDFLIEVQQFGIWQGRLALLDKFGVMRTLMLKARLEYQDNGEIYIRLQGHEMSHSAHAPISQSGTNDLYKILFNTSSSSIFLVDFSGKILDANEAALSYFIHTLNDISGKNLQDIFLQAGIEVPQINVILKELQKKEAFRFSFRGNDRRGRYATHELTFKRGKFYEKDVIVAFSKDITREFDSEESLMSQFHEVRVIRETMRFVSGNHRVDLVLLRALEKLQSLGYLQAAGIYRIEPHRPYARLYFHLSIENALLEHLKEINLDDYMAVFQDKRTMEIAEKAVCDEQRFPLLFVPIVVENKTLQVLLFCLDGARQHDRLLLSLLGTELSSHLTQTRLKFKKEFAEKSLEVKKMFLSNMSHEIRTPMNGIVGMIDLLAESDLDEEQKFYVSTIKKSSGTLLHILNDILDLSKIEAGKMELRKTPISLTSLVDKVYALFSQQALSRDLILSYHFSADLPEGVFADETRLLQILSNLVSNALKFTEQGEVKIMASLISLHDGTAKIKIEVVDTGIGIAVERIPMLFQKFTQANYDYLKAGGTGLGLAISQELCRLMNGEIGVISEKNKGSNFWFNFEADLCSPEKLKQANDSQVVVKTSSLRFAETPLVLVTDDNSVNLKVAKTILHKAGCRVETAQSGEIAIKLVQEHDFDLIFMDIQMPVMDGLETAQHIRKLNIPNLAPIVAMTAFSMQEERDNFLNSGMDDYIAKPIQVHTLVEKIKKWLSHKLLIEYTDEQTGLEASNNSINLTITDNLKKFGDDEFIQTIYSEFASETDALLERCREALKLNDLHTIAKQIHTLKGNAGTLGVEKIANLAILIEENINNNQVSSIKENLDKLYLRFEEYLKNYKKLIK